MNEYKVYLSCSEPDEFEVVRGYDIVNAIVELLTSKCGEYDITDIDKVERIWED